MGERVWLPFAGVHDSGAACLAETEFGEQSKFTQYQDRVGESVMDDALEATRLPDVRGLRLMGQ